MSAKTVEYDENDYQPPPKWLTAEYIEDKLQKFYKDASIKVLKLFIKPAIAKGENYTSTMKRIKVDYKRGKDDVVYAESLIVKSGLEDDNPTLAVMNEYSLYERELEMYDKILPKMTKLLRDIDDKDKIFANTIDVDYNHKSIIFEDLSVGNYVMKDRLVGLDMEHAKLVLHKIAKFHAAGSVLQEHEPEIFKENYDKGMFNRHTQANEDMIIAFWKALLRYVEGKSDLKEKYYKKLANLLPHIINYAIKIFDVDNKQFMTLIHGDLWSNNIMFKYDSSGKIPLDVVPVDYQLTTWTSPALDLHYFIHNSLQENVLQHKEELIQFYHQTLVDMLKRLNFKGRIPSLFNFHLEVESRSFYAVLSAFVFKLVMSSSNSEEAEYGTLIAETEAGERYRKAIFESKRIKENIELMLPYFDRKGLLDLMD